MQVLCDFQEFVQKISREKNLRFGLEFLFVKYFLISQEYITVSLDHPVHCTVLQYTLLHCTTLFYTMYITTLHYTAVHYTVLYSTQVKCTAIKRTALQASPPATIALSAPPAVRGSP